MSVTKVVRTKNGKRIIRYRAEVYVRGVRLASKFFDTKTSAHNWHDFQKGAYLKNPKTLLLQNQSTFSKCLEDYVEYARNRVTKATFQVYENRLPYLKDSPLSRLKMADISADTVDIWIDWLIEHPTAKNPGRKNFDKEIEILSTILNWYRNYKDASFVVPITKRHREKAVYKAVKLRRPDYFARPEEIRSWILWLKDHRPPVYWKLASLLILTGCRIGEACALQWDAVDLDLKIARIFRTVHWDHHTKDPYLTETTKTEGSNRVVLLPEELVGMLKEMRLASGGKGYLFEGKNKGPLRYNAVQSAFNAGFTSLELPWRSTHICRHTFATISLFATRDLSGVQASLGHTKQAMTEKYAKVTALLDSGNSEKTAAAFDIFRNHAQNHALKFKKKITP